MNAQGHTRRAVAIGVGHYLPERVVENAEFEKTIDTSDEWIRSRSGIERRHFAAEGQTTSDLGIKAAEAALADAVAQVRAGKSVVIDARILRGYVKEMAEGMTAEQDG